MTPLVLLLLAAPAPKVPAPTITSLVGVWRAKYWEQEGTLHLRRDGAFGWTTKDTVTAGTWGVKGRALWLRWEVEYSRSTGRRTGGFGDSIDSLVQVRRGAWALHRGGTGVLFFRGRVP
jgi:hypothetical protein